MSIDPIQGGPEIEQIIADWILNKFGIAVRIRRGTVHDPFFAWQHFIIAHFHGSKIESGSWCHPQSLHQIEIGDPELFKKLEVLIRIRLNEISRDYGYAGMLAESSRRH